MKKHMLISGLLMGAVAFVSAATNDLTTTLQRGLFEEEANQNLGAAIQAYQSVANQFDKDRKLAATAIFRLGECYRKQGNTNDAAVQYERILRDFSDQPTLVLLSRQNLTAMGSAPAPANTSAPMLSDAARQEQKRLLQEEIKLVQTQLDAQKKQVDTGVIAPSELVPNQRELLRLKRQVAALDAGLPVSIAASETVAPATSSEADEIKRIQTLIKDSPDLINAPDRKGETLLQAAAAKGKLAIIKLLWENGAAVDGLQQPGLTPLHYAAANGHKAVVDLLLSKGAKASAETEGAVTPLHLAARKGYEEVAKDLLTAGAPINAATKNRAQNDSEDLQYSISAGQTPLHLAVAAGYTGLVDGLLAKGADPNTEDGNGRTPMSYAADRHNDSVVQRLLAAHANPNAGSQDLPLALAAYSGDLGTLKLLLANGADPMTNAMFGYAFNGRGSSYSPGVHCTPLGLAVNRQHAEAAKELVRYKADPNGKMPNGNPVLYEALADPATLKVLLEGGANPNQSAGGTPLLLLAVGEKNQSAVELLLAYHAEPNCATQDGTTPLYSAAAMGLKSIADSLLKAGASVNATNRNGDTPLHTAADGDQLDLAELLLANKADPNAKNRNGFTPLHLAVRSNHRDIAKLLLANKADPNVRSKDGQTPLDWAKSLAQQPQPGQPGLMPLPTRNLRGVYPGQPPSMATAVPEPEPKPQTMADLLRQHGALDDLPHLDQIGIRRSSTGFSNTPFTKSPEDWSQYTVLDLLAVQYKLLTALPDQGGGASSASSALFGDSRLPFPDLAHLHISRPTADLKSWQDQVIDLSAVMGSGDCSKNMRLRWGDVVEVPEADHPLNEKWTGFTREELANLKKCLTRKVEIVVKGQATTVTLSAKIAGLEGPDGTTPVPSPGGGLGGVHWEPTIYSLTPFWLRPVLLQSKLVLISSDLSHVKVIRQDAATGQKREWTVDCSKAGNDAPNLWLQDGDRIEVPEKTFAATGSAEEGKPSVGSGAHAEATQTTVPLSYQWRTDQPLQVPPSVAPQPVGVKP
jgi:ankyrin repeat protein